MTIEDGIRTDRLTREEVERGESSHAKLLGMVRPGSSVLECGPQNGIMTRYLKEELGCRVYIVEIDPQCFQKASAYADGGVCANLEEDGWLERFEDASFDYILYADVLEHLHDPLAVLTKMKRFLREDGSALLTVPNVAHGDVLMNLLCDQFNYLTPGLLAPEHIHLFALESIRETIRRAGYYEAYEGATYAPLFHTEQGPFIPENRRDELRRIIRGHATKEAYQFVFRLSTRETQTLSDEEKAMCGQGEVRSAFYFDCDGKGFSQTQKAEITGKRKKDGRVVYQVLLPQGCEAVRFDPVEGQCCLLDRTVTTVDGREVKAEPVNGVKLAGGGTTLYGTLDPQMIVFPGRGGKRLTVETGVAPLGEEGWLCELCERLSDALAERDHAETELEHMRETLSWKLTAPLRRVRTMMRGNKARAEV